MRLLLIRHGETPNNVAGIIDTAAPGAGLTPLGHVQADAVSTALADQPIAGVYASTLLRAQRTAEPLARRLGLHVQVRDGLQEVAAGDFDLRSDSAAVAGYHACLAAWIGGDLDRRMPGAPDGHAFLRRFDSAIASIVGDHAAADTIAIFTHATCIHIYTRLRTTSSPSATVGRRIGNTGMAVLQRQPHTGWELTAWRSDPLGGHRLRDPAAHDLTETAVDQADTSRQP